MSDVVERAKHCREWGSFDALHGELLAEVERLRKYRSIPPGMVWQDYYSPDEVIKIRKPLEDEIERLQHELRDAARRIKAFAKDCATHGDMTPMAKIQWNKLADTIAKVEP